MYLMFIFWATTFLQPNLNAPYLLLGYVLQILTQVMQFFKIGRADLDCQRGLKIFDFKS